MSTLGPNPSGLCMCGCNGKTSLATRNDTQAGIVKGQPRRFLTGHGGGGKVKHGYAIGGQSVEYRTWNRMIQRCTNPKVDRYSNYGGRGVAVCKRWRNFKNFIADMGPKPAPKHRYSIGRFLDLGDYTPDNCKWMTRKEQIAEAKKKRELLKGRAA